MDVSFSVLQSMPDHGLAVLDREGTITSWNPAAERLTGHPAARAVGSDLVWLDGSSGSARAAAKTLEGVTSRPLRQARWRVRANGSRFWCESTLFALRHADGEVAAFAECFRDATEDHARALALQDAADNFSAALRAGSIVVFSQDRELRYTWVPVRAPELGLGAADQVLGRTDAELFAPETADALIAAKRAVIESGAGTRMDIVVKKDDEPLYYDVIVEPLADADGTVAGITGAFVDVTEHRRAEQALRQSRERLAEAERVARMGSWEWDIANNEVHWSDGLFAIYGLDKERFPARYEPGSERVHPDDHDRVDAAVRHAVETAEPIDLDYRVVRPDGRVRRLHGRAEVICDEQGRSVRLAGTAQDVTEVRAAEDALERTAAELTRRALELHRVTRHGANAGQTMEALLSTRQHEILALVADGHSNAEIAARLFVSESTVKWHVRQILRTLGVSNRAQAVARYLGSGPSPDE